ncbi:MAG: deoxyribonuclease HsdR [Bacteroidetes bacterium]|nr:MAG: deoxyribonuclease HsdR [Bacteroidota bacterium]
MNTKNIIIVFTASLIGGIISFTLSNYFKSPTENELIQLTKNNTLQTELVSFNNSSNVNFDFSFAAEKSVNAVVHITTQYTQKYRSNSLYDFFYGNQSRTYSKEVPLSSGSGVIISNDGYIVTNNHVIENSDKIKVVLNDKRTYIAKLIGKDKSTDLALLKIEEIELPFLSFGNSDDLKIGEWVLAIGNPFNLNSTVTAGIISAKARNINILAQNYAIESFIQTDAAVNPGNSGGALVNTNGQLVGINTAIASKTGSYIGYSFAVPVSIVRKIVSDLIEFGEVQRAFLDVNITDINAEIKEQLGLDKIEGVYVANALENGAAYMAGIKKGDIIIKINDVTINKVSELQEQLSKYRPADTLNITAKRNGIIKSYNVVLHNRFGETDIVKNRNVLFLGAKLKEVPAATMRYLNLQYGVQIKDVGNKELYRQGIKNGFIVTSINNTPIYEVSDIISILQNVQNRLVISGLYPNGISAYYIVNL